MDDLYVFNNPWSVQSMEKATDLLRDDASRPAGAGDLAGAAQGVRAAAPISSRRSSATPRCSTSSEIGEQARLSAVHEAVRRRRLGRREPDRRPPRSCSAAYDESGKRLMHLQKAVDALRPVRALHRRRAAGPRHPLRPVGAAARPLQGRLRLPRRRRVRAAARHDADDQHLLRLGLQLLRVPCARTACSTRSTSPTPAPTRRSPRCTTTSPGWSWPSCAGRCSAPRPTARCAARWTGSRTTTSRRGTCPTASGCARTARSPASGSRPSAFDEFCEEHLAASRRGRLGVLRQRRRHATPCARRSRRCSRRTRSSSSPSTSGA